MRRPVRVVVVDDSAFVRRAFARILRQTPEVVLVGEARDGQEAVDVCAATHPEVVLLDVRMPVRDGLSALVELRQSRPHLGVVLVSGAGGISSGEELAALGGGRVQFVDKSAVSTMELHALGARLLEAIRAAAAEGGEAGQPLRRPLRPSVLVVGASTGGPPALELLHAGLGRDFPAPVVVVQHIPEGFLQALAARLGARVPHASERLEPGGLYLAPGGSEAILAREGVELRLVLRPPAPDAAHTPSVDALFSSAARTCGPGTWGVLLTGMGRDGAEGLLAIRLAGGLTVAQDAPTSAVWGMPGAAVGLGAAERVLPLPQIAPFLRQALASDTSALPSSNP
ncbi:MAG: response regulator [Myxococcaceae bacterium]|nr:response regulator [Myxococcaceae bacterium]